MKQQSIAWDADVSLPVSGITPHARHASASGAVVAQRRIGRKVLAYLSLLQTVGNHGISDFGAVLALNMHERLVAGVQSINSIRDSLGDLVEHTGTYERTEFNSRRGKYRLSAAGRAWMRGR